MTARTRALESTEEQVKGSWKGQPPYFSRRRAIRLGTSVGSLLLIGASMSAGLAAGQPDEEEEEFGLFTKVKNKIADYDKGVIIEFDGSVAFGDPEEGEYFEAEVELEEDDDSTQKGVIVTAGDFESTLLLDEDPPELGLFIEFGSTQKGVIIDDLGDVVTVSENPDDVAKKGVIIMVTFEGIGTTPSLTGLSVEESDKGVIIT